MKDTTRCILAFFDFPIERWHHLRTGNPLESVFATVRDRTAHTKRALAHNTATLMVFKPVITDSKTWRRRKRENQLPKVIAGIKSTDDVATDLTTNQDAS